MPFRYMTEECLDQWMPRIYHTGNGELVEIVNRALERYTRMFYASEIGPFETCKRVENTRKVRRLTY